MELWDITMESQMFLITCHPEWAENTNYSKPWYTIRFKNMYIYNDIETIILLKYQHTECCTGFPSPIGFPDAVSNRWIAKI